MFATILDAHIGASISRMMKIAFGPCAAKRAAPYADASHRTLEKAIQGRTELGAWKLLKMARHPEFRAALRAYLDRVEQEEAETAINKMAIDAQRPRSGAGGSCAPRAPARATALRATAEAAGARRGGVK